MNCTIYTHEGKFRVSLDRYQRQARSNEKIISNFSIDHGSSAKSKQFQEAGKVFGNINTEANRGIRSMMENVLEDFLVHLFTAETIRRCTSGRELEKLFESYGLKIRLEADKPARV
ncbi:MAG: hypothetical protein M3Q24_02595 [bacterium]|nr:hypothetical protein [bacterium]